MSQSVSGDDFDGSVDSNDDYQLPKIDYEKGKTSSSSFLLPTRKIKSCAQKTKYIRIEYRQTIFIRFYLK